MEPQRPIRYVADSKTFVRSLVHGRQGHDVIHGDPASLGSARNIKALWTLALPRCSFINMYISK